MPLTAAGEPEQRGKGANAMNRVLHRTRDIWSGRFKNMAAS
ncbi:hypothetical protein [Streptomyces sp. NPDC001652]